MAQTFDSYAELRAGVLQLLTDTRRTLDLFDPTGRDLGLDKPAFADALAALLRDPGASIRIVVHDTAHIERDCARLLQLLRFHGHQISIHRTLPEAQQARDTLVISDTTNVLRRYHVDYARGTVEGLGEAQSSPWLQRFEALWEASEPAVSFTTLGL